MRRLLLPIIASVLIAGCASSPRVHVTQHPDADFSAYRTFNFHPDAGVDEDAYETAVAAFIKREITEQMTARGYQLDANPDLLVYFELGDRDLVETRDGPSVGIAVGHGRPGWSVGYGVRSDVRSYAEGSLRIDLLDPTQGAQMWTATAIDRIANEDRDNAGQTAQQAVREIFQNFPYAAGGARYAPPESN